MVSFKGLTVGKLIYSLLGFQLPPLDSNEIRYTLTGENKYACVLSDDCVLKVYIDYLIFAVFLRVLNLAIWV